MTVPPNGHGAASALAISQTSDMLVWAQEIGASQTAALLTAYESETAPELQALSASKHVEMTEKLTARRS